MDSKNLTWAPVAAFLPSAAALFLLALAAGSDGLAPHGLAHRPLEMFGWLLVAAIAALYRPWLDLSIDRGAVQVPALGLGALVLPAAIERLGGAPAAMVAALAVLAAETAHRLVRRRSSAAMRDGGWLGVVAERSLLVFCGVLAAAFVAIYGLGAGNASPPSILGWRIVAPAATYLLVLVAASVATRELHRFGSRATSRPVRPEDFLPLVLDVIGWVLGTLAAALAAVAGWARLWPLVLALALMAAEAARQALLHEAAALRRAELERLQHAHRRILGEISGLGGIAQQILTECGNVLPVEHFQLELHESDGTRSWSAGPNGALYEGLPRPTPRPGALPGVHRRTSWKVLEKPLIGEGETLAVVRLWCDPRRIEAGAEDLFATLVPQMAASLDRARLDRESKIDPLTGVPVRRLLESRLQQAWRLSSEEGEPISVILCDIDHFKRINDTWGHTAGDEALKLFAATLDSHRREGDLCCRYGGEEFTLLLESTHGEAALRLAERLRRAVEELDFRYDGESIPLRFSAGVASYPEIHVKTASELILLADEALYQAKEQGRNQCLLHLGRGTYRGPAGRTVGGDSTEAEPSVPRIFG